ncbi:hypothetical protein A6769_39615 [Nostoc punctiforme NIES-2108]|uniref:Uncharacterized protein n=1 Tax=Nostoc punctiforme NIES-2108 TaxID=1356359 RepID=A0A367RXV9_NOSPU|nr:hypothetical protein A6769_39615 [Nostoc punctiforme NIES-2108]
MITPAQLLNSSATRYQQALNNLLKFWHINGQCKTCPYRTNCRVLIEQQIAIKEEVKVLIKK